MSFCVEQVVARFTARSPPPVPVPPVRNGEPGTGVKAPFPATANPDTVFWPDTSSFVYTKLVCAYRFVAKKKART